MFLMSGHFMSHTVLLFHLGFFVIFYTMNVPALTQLTEFSEQLTTDYIGKFKVQLNLPTALFQVTGGVQFLIALKKWGNHNPYAFYQALLNIRPDLVAEAAPGGGGQAFEQIILHSTYFMLRVLYFKFCSFHGQFSKEAHFGVGV